MFNENLWSLHKEYKKILSDKDNLENDRVVEHLVANLPFLWSEKYRAQSKRITDICRIQNGSFEYIFDDYSTMEKRGIVHKNQLVESRLVAVYGRSIQINKQRDDYRLRGWIGRTQLFFGSEWDKGHFIAHSIGGSVDGTELNVFLQKREINRGWSNAGKIFRKMEVYCYNNPGTFCFNRPIYSDETSKPAYYEFGILKSNREFWIECFNNH